MTLNPIWCKLLGHHYNNYLGYADDEIKKLVFEVCARCGKIMMVDYSSQEAQRADVRKPSTEMPHPAKMSKPERMQYKKLCQDLLSVTNDNALMKRHLLYMITICDGNWENTRK